MQHYTLVVVHMYVICMYVYHIDFPVGAGQPLKFPATPIRVTS